jgi:polyhydroxyalkanoate synthase
MASASFLGEAQTQVQRAIQRNLKGLAYFGSPAPVLGSSGKDTIVARGPWRLYHYHPLVEEVYRVPILLVMATTNRGYIFDMAPGTSLVEFLLLQGYDVFMVDWEAPRPEDRQLGLKEYVQDFVGGSIAEVRRVTGEHDISLLGYCMGGVLSVMWSGLNHADGPHNLVVFTTPVDFTKMTLFQAWSDERYFDVDQLVDTIGLAPADMLLSAFDMLRPAGRAAANFQLFDNLWNDEFVKSHRMYSRWSNDMLPLAGEYFRETTKRLIWNNELLKGELKIGGRPVALDEVSCPFLHVTAEHDHIVTSEASGPLIDLIGSDDKEQLVLKGGHVSMLAGPNAVKRMWPKLDAWLGKRSV